MSYFFVENFSPLGGGYDHLVEDGLFLLQVCDLVLEVEVFLFLVEHSPLQLSIQGFHEWVGGILNFLVGIVDPILHGGELLPEKLNQLMVLL